MKITRRFTKDGQNPFATTAWTTRSSKITNPDGSVVFEMPDAEVPESWSQLATDIMVSKYFRKAGVPVDGGPNGLPWVGRLSEPTSSDSQTARESVQHGNRRVGSENRPTQEAGSGNRPTQEAGSENRSTQYVGSENRPTPTGPERSAKQVIHRLAGCWRHWGLNNGYFDSVPDADAFYDEIVYMLVHQMAAPNSPQWFNTGLNWAYGINGPAQGHWVSDHITGETRQAADAYTHPQPHACFIQSIKDTLVGEDGIMDLWTREARLFKYGSGTGTNFSNLRAADETLSGGGKSSGLMSWLKIGDRAAGAIKSGGTTRRAAKMVCLDLDHPDIRTFVNWKVREEIKVAAMVEGLKAIGANKASDRDTETLAATAERLGLHLDYDFNGEAYATVSGQNSNNSVRIPDAFFDALDAGEPWQTRFRVGGEVAANIDAGELWDDIGYAAWRCADPGVQYDTTINAWHTCPEAGRINASNPCSEYMFIDDTACNLASFNVLKFYDAKKRVFDVEAFEHAIDLWTMVLEISVLMAAFPSEAIAERSWKYRTLGLGYANLGAMLMQAGIAYDSPAGRAICGALSAVLTGRSYRMSAELAGEHGAFAGFDDDRGNMLRVIRNHRRAAHGTDRDSGDYEELRTPPVSIDHELFHAGSVTLANHTELFHRATAAWDDALLLGERNGYRNAQVTVIAPTGTIGLLMDCDTTGVEPDFALVKFKKLAGGGYFKIANQSVEPALRTLGYDRAQIDDILAYLLGTLGLDVPMPGDLPEDEIGTTFSEWLIKKGLELEDLEAITRSLPGVFDLPMAFGAWTLSEDALTRLGFDPAAARSDRAFDALRALGLDSHQIDHLNTIICGTQTIEGAPHMQGDHLCVFDCASTCGRTGKRLIHVEGHIRMMAAAQPFISGAISKTINLPHDATVEDIQSAYRLSWELGLKANALYRDGCKLSQPLNAKADAKDEQLDLDEVVDEFEQADAIAEVTAHTSELIEAAADGDVRIVREKEVQIIHRPLRRRLPDTRFSRTHKFNIAGHEGYLTVGLYEDNKPGELFITMAKEGSTIGGLMDSLGTATSVALQYGVPLESLVRKFTHQRFEPAGMTTNRDIPFAKSLVDYIFRWIGMEFIEGYREANAPHRTVEAEPKPAEPRPAPTRITEPETPVVNTRRPMTMPSPPVLTAPAHSVKGLSASASATLSAALDAAGDAPACDVCGTITVRSGTCYKCLNCGNSMGCS